MAQDYNKTLNLPQTDFAMRASLPQREPGMLAEWNEENLYQKMVDRNEGKPTYILHDGPPYANGDIHLGTALNKVLKDMIVRSKNMTGYQSPFDITVQNRNADALGPMDFDALLEEHGVNSSALSWQQDTIFYYNDASVTGIEEASAAVRLSDYNALLAHGGRGSCHEEVPMVPDDPERRAVTGGLSLSYAVVPDELAGQLEVRRQVWFVDYAGGDEERTEAELLQLIRPLDLDYALHFSSRLDAYQSIMGSKILALFLGLYLGFTFLLAAAAVLALQQLSQAADNQKRYAMLRRLGADDGLIARSASQQVALAFLMPLGLALIHSMVGMKAANDIIATAGEVDSVGSSLATAAVLILVYGGYFLATALACRRMARQSWTKLE